MSDLDTIRIPSFVSFAIKNIIISRGLAKEIIDKRNDNRELYNISLHNRLTLQSVGYISRYNIKDIEQAPAS